MKKYVLGLLALAGALVLKAQTLTGKVFDELNREPLVGATVRVLGTDQGEVTNEQGAFAFQDLPPGRWDVVVSYVGYRPVEVRDVWLKPGKITKQDVALVRNVDALEGVEVSASRPLVQPGMLTITEEQVNRLAATYYDPARLLTASPDVAVTNDQNNDVSVRGLAPSFNVWKLEGMEIVNPNHLSNAGTFNDRPTAAGGGVNMLSAQMLSRSEFLYSTFDNRHGNSVGGIFNMQLKKGTEQDRQYTAQGSFIGMDLAAEGPFRQGGKTTYAANYRYSFTGLLTGFGVDFGGESIGFQDLSFNVVTPTGDRSELIVFGVGGLSFNEFTHKAYEESEVEKDRKNINYYNQTGIVGAKWSAGNDKGRFSLGVAYSIADNERDETTFDQEDEAMETIETRGKQRVLSVNVAKVRQVGKGRVEYGLMQNFYELDYVNVRDGSTVIDESLQQWLSRPYLRFVGNLGKSLTGYMGTGVSLTKGDQSLDPRIGVSYTMGKRHSLGLGAGRYSQLLDPDTYYFDAGYGETFVGGDVSEYGLMPTYKGTLSHDVLGDDLTLHSELFYYYFPEVWSVKQEGRTDKVPASSYGLSVLLTKEFSKLAYLNLGGTLLESKVDGDASYFNTNHSLTLAAGKEWDVSKASKNRRLSVDLRAMHQGGYRPYDNAVMERNLPSDFFDQRAYLRFDLRVVWKRYLTNRTTSLALDLQNVANIENFAYQYDDDFTNQWETQNQLGLIPIVAYRVEW